MSPGRLLTFACSIPLVFLSAQLPIMLRVHFELKHLSDEQITRSVELIPSEYTLPHYLRNDANRAAWGWTGRNMFILETVEQKYLAIWYKFWIGIYHFTVCYGIVTFYGMLLFMVPYNVPPRYATLPHEIIFSVFLPILCFFLVFSRLFCCFNYTMPYGIAMVRFVLFCMIFTGTVN